MHTYFKYACVVLQSQSSTMGKHASYIIILITFQDAIHRIRMQFNKEFDEVYGKKEHEIMRIAEKSKRIHKILADLDLKEDVYEPEMGVAEKPEMLLEVADSEVTMRGFPLQK